MNTKEIRPKVFAKTWSGGQLTSLKGPTCVLIRPDGKTLEAFGYEAETRYSELSEDDQHKKWYYFRRFKMSLWKKDDLSKISGSRVDGLKEDDIHWVLTVPAIWNDSAKQFMRLSC
ncbi:hypothetical protein DPMN_107394 [Dreissena polymorpha]|uniref:Uncharacterized protein n=1 Tax=Dreissena polymorpha TaxID=45954 RepID=A0A9D4QJW6_DREPO|nr:hypothetical protein DPMN_107394 [Dreissena polymorpha]